MSATGLSKISPDPSFAKREIIFVGEIPPLTKGDAKGIFLANGEYNLNKP